MKHPERSILNTAAENQTLLRLRQLEEQVNALTDTLTLHGISIIRCEFCGDLLWNKNLYCYGLHPTWLNAVGTHAIMIRKGEHRLYFCAEHLPEAYDLLVDWDDTPERNSALNTIAHWVLVHHTDKTQPQLFRRSRELIKVSDIQERCRLLSP